MVRRLVLLLLSLSLGVWVLGAGLVVLFETFRPEVAEPVEVARDAPAGEVAAAWGLRAGGGWFRTGYTDFIGAEIEDWEYGCLMRRGPLDRRAATFPLSIRYASNTKGGIRTVSLYVTSSSDFPNSATSEPIATVVPLRVGEFDVALFCEVPVPAGTRTLEVREIAHDGAGFSMGHSVPRAETWAGRVYDRYAWWPVFRWLPGGD